MTPVVWINCDSSPFVDDIMLLRKTKETRTRNMLGKLEGMRVFLAETHRRRSWPSLVRCSAVIGKAIAVYSAEEWDAIRSTTCIPAGSSYDWKPGTRVKYAYSLSDVQVIPVPFTPPAGRRHGYVWMECKENL